MEVDPVGFLIVAAGLFSIAGAYFDWNWFMTSSRAKLFVWILGRNGARVFYGLLGILLMVVGMALGLKMLD